MNWSVIVGGVIIAGGFWTIFDSVFGLQIPMWHNSAFAIVLFGSLGLSLVALGWQRTTEALRTLFGVFWLPKDWKDQEVLDGMTELARAHRDYNVEVWDKINFDEYAASCKQVIKDAVVSGDARKSIFYTKYQLIFDQSVRRALQVRHLGQYPIAIGLLNLLVSCFALSWSSTHAGQADKVMSTISFGFLSVIYGFFISHLWIHPAARRLYERARSENLRHQMMAHGFDLIAQGSHPVQVGEELSAYLEKRVSSTSTIEQVEMTKHQDGDAA